MTDRSDSDWKWIRMEVLVRDEFTCQECGDRGGRYGEAMLHVDHIKPVNRGGGDEVENLRVLCRSCHLQRTKTDPEHSMERTFYPDTECPHDDCDKMCRGEHGAKVHYRQVHGKPYPEQLT